MISNFFSRDLGVDVAGSGVRMAGILRGVPRVLLVADRGDLDVPSGGELCRSVGEEATSSRTCTLVGSEAQPDPSDDQVSDVERVVEEGVLLCELCPPLLLLMNERVFIGKHSAS